MKLYPKWLALLQELKGMVDEKIPSWVKHAVRRWKQFYNEIQFIDGQGDTTNPLSEIFRNEALMTKHASQSQAATTCPEPTSSKKKATRSQPEKSPPSKPEQKQSKGRFIFKLKELQCLFTLPNFSWGPF